MTVSILERYIEPSAICLHLPAGSSEEIITALAGRLEASGYVADSYRAAVLRREQTLPTGLPLSEDLAVAVPHTDPEHVLRPGVGIATLAHPVAFQNMEDPDEELPVRVVFALALKDKNEQIEMLQMIASMLQDPDHIRTLINARSSDDLMDAIRLHEHSKGV